MFNVWTKSKHNVKSICTLRTLPPMTVMSCPANTKSRQDTI